MLITILGLIGSILPSLLQGFGVSASIDNLIPTLLTAITGIIANITSKAPVTSELAVLQTALTALQADKSLSPVILGDISEGVADLQAAITAYQAGQTKTDPSTLTPLPSLA